MVPPETEMEQRVSAEHLFEHMFAGAYWGDRAEGAESAAARLTAMVDSLAPLGRGFTDWLAATDRPLPRGEALTAWFEKAYEIEKAKGRPDVGAHVWFMSEPGHDSRALEVYLTVGAHPESSTAPRNAVVMSPLTADGDDVVSIAPVDVVVALVRAWEPDWAVASTELVCIDVSEAAGRGDGVIPGAVTWLADRLVTPQTQALLADLGAERVEAGWLLDCRVSVAEGKLESVTALARALG